MNRFGYIFNIIKLAFKVTVVSNVGKRKIKLEIEFWVLNDGVCSLNEGSFF